MHYVGAGVPCVVYVNSWRKTASLKMVDKLRQVPNSGLWVVFSDLTSIYLLSFESRFAGVKEICNTESINTMQEFSLLDFLLLK